MPESAEPLRRVLNATDYFRGGRPAVSAVTVLNGDAQDRRRTFRPDVRWRSQGGLNVYFKFVENPSSEQVSAWQREVWNEGDAPLLWLVSPTRTEVYNGFGVPRPAGGVIENRVGVYHHDAVDAARGERGDERLGLAELNGDAGRLAMASGRFWQQDTQVSRQSSVGQRLLRDMAALERILVGAGLSVDKAQALICRSVFAKCLLDRNIISEELLAAKFGAPALADVLRDEAAAGRLFDWIATRFNGDMFAPKDADRSADHSAHVADFLDGLDFETGEKTMFPYRFDLIPVEIVGTVYEQFAHSKERRDSSRKQDVHYTPTAAVSLVLDEVMQGLTGDETVLDMTCGSGVFLVGALRRLVALKAGDGPPARAMIRQALQQIHGVDLSPEAVRIAAFSLHLAAWDLDPNPILADDMRCDPFAGANLLVGDAHGVENTPQGKAVLTAKAGLKQFDLIVGNPPWSHQGRCGNLERRARMAGKERQPRGVSLDFVDRAKDFAHAKTRFGMIVSATHFFSRSDSGRTATQKLVESLQPVTLINLANQVDWLFPRAHMPAMALLARHREQDSAHMHIVQAPWSPTGDKSHSLEMTGTDVQTLPLASWRRNPGLMKASFLGKLHDHLLLEHLAETQETLKQRLRALGTKTHLGLTLGNLDSQDAGPLLNLPYLDPKIELRSFAVPDDLPKFEHLKVERPRDRNVYRAPLIIMDKYLKDGAEGPRLRVGLAERDTVFTGRHFGVSFPMRHAEKAPLLAGVLRSSLAAWYFLMTGSSFGLWMGRLLMADVNAMPMPDLASAVGSKAGCDIRRLVRRLQSRTPLPEDWRKLDEAVMDLYGLDGGDRAVVRDGLLRAGWQWQTGRRQSVAPARPEHLQEYAQAFASKIDPWLQAGQKHQLRAEIHASPSRHADPLRLVRFVLEQRAPQPGVKPAPWFAMDQKPPSPAMMVPSNGLTHDALMAAAQRLGVADADENLSRFGELRMTGQDEVVIVKPAARRHWLAVNAFADARAVLEGGFKADVA